jgi:ectoine hydroxylase-related dioxygenase (phytanoyl-CoA dioxygenase family)
LVQEAVVLDDPSFTRQLEEQGYVLVPGVLDSTLVQRCRAALEKAITAEAAYHGSNDYVDFGMVQCCALYDRVFIDLLCLEPLMAPFNLVLGDGCIVYAYTSSSMPPQKGNFSVRIHVDCPRLIPGYLTNFGVIVPLDEFNVENGATWFLPGSHHRAAAPDDEEFFSNAVRLEASAGSAWFFNPRLWHSGGVNTTGKWRHSFTINMCRPYMKQRIDLPRLLANVDLNGLTETALQKLGFFAQPPTSLDEYYAPPERRMFRQRYE